MSISLFNPQGTSAPTQTTLASSGGLLVNIDSATGDIARTTDGFIEDEKFGINVAVFSSTLSSKFTSSTLFGFSGSLCAYTNVTNIPVSTYCRPIELIQKSSGTIYFPVKPSTKYKLKVKIWRNITYTSGNGVRFISSTYNSSNTVVADVINATITTSGTDIYTHEFTTGASVVTIKPALWYYSGVVGEVAVDINSMTLEEVVEPVANTLTSSSPSLVSFTAVGSTDNIDQSQTAKNTGKGFGQGGATASVVQDIAQQFLPTKSKFTSLVFQRLANVGTFTGTVTVSIVNDNAGSPGTTTLASYTYSNAAWNALGTDTDITVNLPCNLTANGSTKYWAKFVASTADASNCPVLRADTTQLYTNGLCQGTVLGVWTTVTIDLYFKTLYYKPTTNFKASQNNSTVSISADEDGFLDGSVINLTTGAFTAEVNKNTLSQSDFANFFQWLYSYSWSYNIAVGLNNNQDIRLFYSGSAAENTFIFKVYAKAFQSVNITIPQVAIRFSGGYLRTSWSLDNSSYTQIHEATYTGSWSSQSSGVLTITPNADVFYIKLAAGQTSATGNQQISLGFTDGLAIQISGTLNLSSLSILRNYPTNKYVIKQYFKTLGSPTTTATYRATKWGFPAIEYSATEYQYLDIDTTAIGSTVAFSETGASYTTVADGASITISSTSTPSIFVKHNITANRLYLSSNDYNASSSKDGSLKQSVVYHVKQNPTHARNSDMRAKMKLTYG